MGDSLDRSGRDHRSTDAPEMEQKKETVPVSLLTLTAGILIALVSFWYGQHHGLMPEQASAQAPLVDRLFDVQVTIATALFFIVEGAIAIAMVRFRKRADDDTDAEPIKGNLPLEAFWTAIPALIVIVLGIYSVDVYGNMGGFEPANDFHAAHGQQAGAPPSGAAIAAPLDETGAAVLLADASREVEYGFGAAPGDAGPDVTVDVNGMQFAWIFEYPEDGIMAGELHVPVGKTVKLNLHAQDVIHSFWVPQFRLKQDAIPGKDTQLQFTATRPGRYPIVCAELCGSYHGGMRSELVVDTEEDYATWLDDNRIASNVRPATVATADMTAAEYLAAHAPARAGVSELVPH